MYPVGGVKVESYNVLFRRSGQLSPVRAMLDYLNPMICETCNEIEIEKTILIPILS